MKLSELKKLAEAATQATDYCGDNADIMESYFDAANPQTILAILALIEKQYEAMKALYDYTPTTLKCNDFHHPKKYQHGSDETCEMTARYYYGMSCVEEALAAYEEMK